MLAGIAQSRWVPLFHCVHSARGILLRNRHSNKALLSLWRAVTTKEREVVREIKEEGTRATGFSELCWLVSFLQNCLTQFEHGVPLERGTLSCE